MGVISKYNPELLHNKAQDCLKGVTKEEHEAWRRMPCTKALAYALEGDLDGIMMAMLSGGYSSQDSIDATSQMTAKARGQAQAISDILDALDNFSRDDDAKEKA